MTFSVEELLEHSEWAHALARQLVGEATEADDLVQEAWVATLQSPPTGVRSLRPWFAGVLRNLALKGRRSGGRRSARERNAARGEALPSAVEIVERAEAQHQLVDAVLALDEPYRLTILLRYFECQSAAEIARARGIPAATVRSHLREGVSRLRSRLDSDFGDRRAWCMALVPLLRVDTVAGGGVSSLATTGLLMMALLKTSAAVGMLAALLIWFGPSLWGASADEPSEAEASQSTPAESSRLTGGEPIAAFDAGVGDGSRVSVPSGSPEDQPAASFTVFGDVVGEGELTDEEMEGLRRWARGWAEHSEDLARNAGDNPHGNPALGLNAASEEARLRYQAEAGRHLEESLLRGFYYIHEIRPGVALQTTSLDSALVLHTGVPGRDQTDLVVGVPHAEFFDVLRAWDHYRSAVRKQLVEYCHEFNQMSYDERDAALRNQSANGSYVRQGIEVDRRTKILRVRHDK